jgi:hypothetical protein
VLSRLRESLMRGLFRGCRRDGHLHDEPLEIKLAAVEPGLARRQGRSDLRRLRPGCAELAAVRGYGCQYRLAAVVAVEGVEEDVEVGDVVAVSGASVAGEFGGAGGDVCLCCRFQVPEVGDRGGIAGRGGRARGQFPRQVRDGVLQRSCCDP